MTMVTTMKALAGTPHSYTVSSSCMICKQGHPNLLNYLLNDAVAKLGHCGMHKHTTNWNAAAK